MLLTVEKHVQGSCLILKVAGDCAEHDGALYFKLIRPWLAPGIVKVIMDLDGVSQITGPSLDELVAAHRRWASAGCQLVLACARERIRKVLALDLADPAVVTADSIEDALAGRRPSRESQRLLGPDGLVG